MTGSPSPGRAAPDIVDTGRGWRAIWTSGGAEGVTALPGGSVSGGAKDGGADTGSGERGGHEVNTNKFLAPAFW